MGALCGHKESLILSLLLWSEVEIQTTDVHDQPDS